MRTSWPACCNARTSALPMKPLPPITAITGSGNLL
jgi:hypothetical protein